MSDETKNYRTYVRKDGSVDVYNKRSGSFENRPGKPSFTDRLKEQVILDGDAADALERTRAEQEYKNKK